MENKVLRSSERFANVKFVASMLELVWRRRKLPASSVEIAQRTRTNPTGGLRLVQDKYEVDGTPIDHTTYFRYIVFGELDWTTVKTNPLVEVATTQFHVFLADKDFGLLDMQIRHKPTGEAGQGNYTTSISWGDISNEVRAANLVGYTLELYRSSEHGTFVINIYDPDLE